MWDDWPLKKTLNRWGSCWEALPHVCQALVGMGLIVLRWKVILREQTPFSADFTRGRIISSASSDVFVFPLTHKR
jgi:hypothetical protein